MNAVATRSGVRDDFAAWIAPSRTAVLIIDIQVDFASPDGALGAYVDMAVVQPAVAAAGRLVEAARTAGTPVIFIGLFTMPETDSSSWKERMRRRGGDPDGESALCRVGQTGSDFYGPKPLPGEPVVKKTRYSGFVGTDLDARLKALGVDTLIAAGLTTECCVDSTVRDAFSLDYHVFVAADACAAYEPDIHAASLKVMDLNSAILTDTAAIAHAWSA
ncbi:MULTISPECIES: cysteine hydrolase [unclassified Caulobacter]|uniref:cysteine hydrolase n=1 Tax=unclassified Caulobacter TaxID=2648921 RepID=UPI0006FBAA9C|nr:MULTISPECIES: cysteine hydrolase [unclassified Caulobacter]KQV57307.1 isochorismatase [Caulobacter sp. Root342]KQV66879.1 isochorismatase [Caulobacter sp. Root343]